MCDQEQLAAFARNTLNRRRFSGLMAAGGGAALTACTATGGVEGGAAQAAGGSVVGSAVAIPTDGGGTMGGWFYHPSTGKHPAVIMWPDIAGVRPASKAMGERLAAEGFAVIVPDPYWRDTGHALFDDFADFAANGGFQTVGPWRARFNGDTIRADARAIVAWLDRQDAVDTAQSMGARGHCMTGAWPIHAAKASPRVKVAASMHGGGLVTDAPDSPHRSFVAGADYHIAIARDDDAKVPEEKSTLATALKAADALGDAWVYPADHGWTVPDSPSYDQPEAERAYAKFLAMCQGLRIVAN